MKRLWYVLVSGFNLILLTVAKPTQLNRQAAAGVAAAVTKTTSNAAAELWEHVNKTCLAHDCDDNVNLLHLNALQRNIKTEANPCENFHEFACGHWQRHHKDGTTMMKLANDLVTDKYIEHFEQVLMQRAEEHQQRVGADDMVLNKLLDYYVACKTTTGKGGGITARGYFEYMREQGWWRSSSINWLELMAELGRYGYSGHFLQMQVKQINASQHRIHVQVHDKEEHVELSPEIYQILNEYTSMSYERLQQEFVRLEDDLAEIVGDVRYNNSSDWELWSYAELMRNSSEIDWALFLSTAMERSIQPNELIAMDTLETLQQIARYLNQAESNELSFLYTLARFFNQLQRLPHSLLAADVSSVSCIRHMRKLLHIPLTYVYERYFYGRVRAESDRVILSIFAQLKAEFSHTLARNEMNFSTNELAYMRKKLFHMRLNIGNVPVNVSAQFYEEYASDLNVSDNFYANHLNALHHTYAHQRLLSELPQPAAKEQLTNPWHTFNMHTPDLPDAIDSTAYYYCLNNMIIIPHAYLQTPFYDQNFWPVLLYGDLANTLGHELIHGFDNNFMLYDYRGNLVDNIYGSIDSNLMYNQRIESISAGTDFLSERIADLGGTRLTLRAFMSESSFLQRHGKLFFLQFAQFFCGAATDFNAFQQEDPFHDLDSVRLNYTLSQIEEFAQVFNCPAGSPMNPAQKFKVW